MFGGAICQYIPTTTCRTTNAPLDRVLQAFVEWFEYHATDFLADIERGGPSHMDPELAAGMRALTLQSLWAVMLEACGASTEVDASPEARGRSCMAQLLNGNALAMAGGAPKRDAPSADRPIEEAEELELIAGVLESGDEKRMLMVLLRWALDAHLAALVLPASEFKALYHNSGEQRGASGSAVLEACAE